MHIDSIALNQKIAKYMGGKFEEDPDYFEPFIIYKSSEGMKCHKPYTNSVDSCMLVIKQLGALITDCDNHDGWEWTLLVDDNNTNGYKEFEGSSCSDDGAAESLAMALGAAIDSMGEA